MSHDYGAITILAKALEWSGLSCLHAWIFRHKKTAVPAKTGTAVKSNMLLLPRLITQ
jgi:hypothetical protein